MDFDKVLATVRTRTRRRFWNNPDVDDLEQEAAIYAWKMYQDGKDEGYITWWAVQKVVRYIDTANRPAAPYTGNCDGRGDTRQTVRTKNGDKIRAKIKQAQSEYYGLHREMPSKAEIGRMTGLEARTVGNYMNRLNFNLADTPSSRPTVMPITSLLVSSGEHEDFDQDKHSDLATALGVEEFEDETLTRLVVASVIPNLKPLEKQVVFHLYWTDLPQAEIARVIGISPAYVYRIHKTALEYLREHVDHEVAIV